MSAPSASPVLDRGRQPAGLEQGRAVPATAGSATVELAAAIPLLVAVTLAMISLLGLARDQVLAQGAAREGAREAAIGGDQTRAAAAARGALPPGRTARVVVAAVGSDRVRVSVERPVRLPFGAPLVAVSATAVAAREPGPPPSPQAHDQCSDTGAGDPSRGHDRPSRWWLDPARGIR